MQCKALQSVTSYCLEVQSPIAYLVSKVGYQETGVNGLNPQFGDFCLIVSLIGLDSSFFSLIHVPTKVMDYKGQS